MEHYNLKEDSRFLSILENCGILNFSLEKNMPTNTFVKMVAARNISKEREYYYSTKILHNLVNQALSPELIGDRIKHYDNWAVKYKDEIEIEEESIINLLYMFDHPEKSVFKSCCRKNLKS